MAIYVVLLIAFKLPVSLDPGARSFTQSPDTRVYLWTLGWDLHALKTDPLHIFDANIFFPEKQTLAYSENLIGAARDQARGSAHRSVRPRQTR